ncbi:hypothetical protein BC940DRAFT_299044 [Gongronella butleri]|nr:hypothetical protein BC940DRAFT_299044 [Gongronella butleri]
MDTANHSVLQFVSAAAMALEAHEVESVRTEESSTVDLGRSIEAISSTHAWSDFDDGDNTLEPSHDQLQALLAEATNTDQPPDPGSASSAATDMRLPPNAIHPDDVDDDEDDEDDENSRSDHPARVDDINHTVQRIFDFPSVERLIAEWPCYIVRSVIVPGFLYLTEQHICFYAPLPNNQNGYHKTGYLMMKASGKMGAKYRRCFFDLQHDALSWYENASDTYSPLGKMDLKYTLAVKRSKRRPFGFRIVTMHKTYHLQADTEAAMNEWLTAVQKAIFKAKNAGSSFKLSFPFANILDIEHTEAFEFQQYLKIRVVGVEDSFVMDEYYFAYFPDIKSTFEQLKEAWDASQVTLAAKDAELAAEEHLGASSLSLEDSPPPLSLSDMYNADHQPIIIPSLSSTATAMPQPQQPQASSIHAQPSPSERRLSRASSVVANMVPGALKDLLYASTSSTTSSSVATKDPVVDAVPPDVPDDEFRQGAASSSSSDDDRTSWLGEKGRSGIRMVYDLLGATGSSASDTTQHPQQQQQPSQDGDIDSEWEMDKQSIESRTGSEPLDDKVMADFQKYFVLPENEKLLAVFRCALLRTLPCYGKLYVSTHHICFNSKGFATKAKVILPFDDVLRIQKIQSKGYILHSLSILTRKKIEFFLEFSSLTKRNSCFAQLYLRHKQLVQYDHAAPEPEPQMKEWEKRMLQAELQEDASPRRAPPAWTDKPLLSSKNELQYTKPTQSLHFTCITIGTRGDVQPYIALCKALMKDGHRCRIATHDEFKDWIEEHHIEFRSIGGDPSELMRFCVENNFFSVNFVMEGLKLFKVWIDELLELAWIACDGTDVLIESPSAMIGVHMAEKLRIPYFRSFPMPMTRTRSFPHPFATPNRPKGRLYNDMTYVLFDHAVWRAISARTNAFREQVLHIPATTYENLEVWKIPYMYSFSTSIVPSPLDWMDWVHCTGYWFLDNPQTGWQPDTRLLSFLQASDKRPVIYIGFGSIIVTDPHEVVRIIVESVLLSNVRAIVSEGWSSRAASQDQGGQGDNETTSALLRQYPDVILPVSSVPHDWLFPKVRAVVHHGGAGTTAAGLRAGRPTVVKPFFADQFFWGERVEEMGVGKCVKTLTVAALSAALRIVTTDDAMLKTANIVGEKIRSESGVETAIQCIYRDMDLARDRTLSSALRASTAADATPTSPEIDTTTLLDDQDWTLVEPSHPQAAPGTASTAATAPPPPASSSSSSLDVTQPQH